MIRSDKVKYASLLFKFILSERLSKKQSIRVRYFSIFRISIHLINIGFHLVSFQMLFLLLFVQVLLPIFEAFV